MADKKNVKKPVKQALKKEPVKKAENIYQRILKAQKSIGVISMDKENKEQKYKYLSDGMLTTKVGSAMVDAGITMIPPKIVSIEDYDKKTKKGVIRISRMQVEFTIVNVDNPEEKVSGAIFSEAMDFGDKALYKCMTGARKYFYRLLFNIASADDPEADNDTNGEVNNCTYPHPQQQVAPQMPLPPLPPSRISQYKKDVFAELSKHGLIKPAMEDWFILTFGKRPETEVEWANTLNRAKAYIPPAKKEETQTRVDEGLTQKNGNNGMPSTPPPVETRPSTSPPVQASPPVPNSLNQSTTGIDSIKISVGALLIEFGLTKIEREKYLAKANPKTEKEWGLFYKVLQSNRDKGCKWVPEQGIITKDDKE